MSFFIFYLRKKNSIAKPALNAAYRSEAARVLEYITLRYDRTTARMQIICTWHQKEKKENELLLLLRHDSNHFSSSSFFFQSSTVATARGLDCRRVAPPTYLGATKRPDRHACPIVVYLETASRPVRSLGHASVSAATKSPSSERPAER